MVGSVGVDVEIMVLHDKITELEQKNAELTKSLSIEMGLHQKYFNQKLIHNDLIEIIG